VPWSSPRLAFLSGKTRNTGAGCRRELTAESQGTIYGRRYDRAGGIRRRRRSNRCAQETLFMCTQFAERLHVHACRSMPNLCVISVVAIWLHPRYAGTNVSPAHFAVLYHPVTPSDTLAGLALKYRTTVCWHFCHQCIVINVNLYACR
jgi:hypothetical protein